MQIRASNHMNYTLDPKNLKATIEKCVNALKAFGLDRFDSIAFRGMSGAMVASCLAMELNKTLIMVRKNITDTHSHFLVEGDYGAKTYVIVDDLISTGNTVKAIVEAVNDHFVSQNGPRSNPPELVGLMLYMYESGVKPRHIFEREWWVQDFKFGPSPEEKERQQYLDESIKDSALKDMQKAKAALEAAMPLTGLFTYKPTEAFYVSDPLNWSFGVGEAAPRTTWAAKSLAEMIEDKTDKGLDTEPPF